MQNNNTNSLPENEASVRTASNGAVPSVRFRIDEHFRTLLPALKAENRAELKDLIRQHGGCHAPLIVWKEEGILLDGHHRVELLEELRSEGVSIREPEVVLMSFPTRTAAMVWVIRHQNGKRPEWSAFEKAKAFFRSSELAAAVAEEAKKRQMAGSKADENQKGRTVDIIADLLGIGRTTVYYAQNAVRAEDELKQLENAERVLKYPGLVQMLENGQTTPKLLKSAIKASDRAEMLNKLAQQARQNLPSFDVVEGDAMNTIVYGDALATLKTLKPATVSLCFTSPPYPILGLAYGNYEYNGNYEQYLKYLEQCWEQVHVALVDGGRFAINFDNTFVQRKERNNSTPMRRNLYADFDQQLRRIGFKYRDTFIWDKNNATAFIPVAKNVRSAQNPIVSTTYEFINVYYKGSVQLAPQAKDQPVAELYDLTDTEWHDWRNKMWCIPAARRRGNHPCPFPLELAERLIRLYSFRGDCVLDPFVGTGTTCAAAAKWGRLFIGIDNDPLAIEDARKRVDAAIEEAKKAATSITLPEPLTDAEKQADAMRRHRTTVKHKKAGMKEVVGGRPRRNRPTSTDEVVSMATQPATAESAPNAEDASHAAA